MENTSEVLKDKPRTESVLCIRVSAEDHEAWRAYSADLGVSMSTAAYRELLPALREARRRYHANNGDSRD